MHDPISSPSTAVTQLSQVTQHKRACLAPIPEQQPWLAVKSALCGLPHGLGARCCCVVTATCHFGRAAFPPYIPDEEFGNERLIGPAALFLAFGNCKPSQKCTTSFAFVYETGPHVHFFMPSSQPGQWQDAANATRLPKSEKL